LPESKPEFPSSVRKQSKANAMSEESIQRGHRKIRVGEVLSTNMDKTIVVGVDRKFRHPLYKKVVVRRKKFYAHDEKNETNVGDKVKIAETRPLSKLKHWRLVEIVEKNLEAVQHSAE